MVGRAPMLAIPPLNGPVSASQPPSFKQAAPLANSPAGPPGVTAPRMPPPAALARGEVPPKVRMHAPEEPPAPRLTLPPPEHFGIFPGSTSAPLPLDWNAAKQRIDRLGTQGFHCDKLPQGSVRVTLLVPSGQGIHQVEAEAATETAAVLGALERAESLRR